MIIVFISILDFVFAPATYSILWLSCSAAVTPSTWDLEEVWQWTKVHTSGVF